MAIETLFNTVAATVSQELAGRTLLDWRKPDARGNAVASALLEESKDIDLRAIARAVKRDAGTPGIQSEGYVRALCRAIARDMTDIATQLVEAGVPPDAKCKSESRLDPEWSPLQSAVESGRLDMLALLRRHAPPDILKTTDTALVWYAVAGRHPEMLAPLLACGADPDKPKIYEDSLSRQTALVRAIADGKREVIDSLLDAGASPQLAADGGNTPLHQAVWSMDAETCKRLLDKGADIEAKDSSGRTPMQCAAYCNLPAAGPARIIEVVKLLAQRGAATDGIAETARIPEVQAAIRAAAEEREAFTSGKATADMSLTKKITASRPVHFKPK